MMTSSDGEEGKPLINTGSITTYSDLLKAHSLVTKEDVMEECQERDFNPSILAHSLEAYLKWPASMSIGDIGGWEGGMENDPEYDAPIQSDSGSWKWEILSMIAYTCSLVYFLWTIKIAYHGSILQLLGLNVLAYLCSLLLLTAPKLTVISMAVLFPISLPILSLLGHPSMSSKYYQCCSIILAALFFLFIYSKRSVLADGINMLSALQRINTLPSLLFGLVYTALALCLVIPLNPIHALIWIWITESILHFQSTFISREAFACYYHAESSKLSLWHRLGLSTFSAIFLTLFTPLRLTLLLLNSWSHHPCFAFMIRYLEPASPYSLIHASVNDKPCLHAGHSMGRLFRHNLLPNSLTCYMLDLVLLLPLLPVITLLNHSNALIIYSIWSITRFCSNHVKTLLDSCYVCFVLDCENEQAPLHTMLHRVFVCKQLRNGEGNRRNGVIKDSAA